MFDKSQERIAIETLITDSHETAQKEAFAWMEKNKIALENITEETVKLFRSMESYQEYLNAYDSLLSLEKKENFPAMLHYAEELDEIAKFIPSIDKGYYACAGTDFYLARIFNSTTFEDIGYGKNFVMNMWWDSGKYTKKSIINTIRIMKDVGIFDKQKINLIGGNSEEKRKDNDLNREDYTLIIKGGHNVTEFINARFKEEEMKFGSLLLISPHEDSETLKEFLEQKNYLNKFQKTGEEFYAPFAMGLQNTYIPSLTVC